MLKGQQVFPHKYVKRELRDGRWAYFYGSEGETYSQATKNAAPHMIVIAHGKPTQILVHPQDGTIISGPPNIVGKSLFLNNNPRKSYFGIARDPLNQGVPPVYLYPESSLRRSVAQKAAKFVKSERALDILDKEAETLMSSGDPAKRDMGLVIWLNNNTQMRIGAHEDAKSVNPVERSKIIMRAKQENWPEDLKRQALEDARKETHGLLTLRNGHMRLEGGKAIFSFLGKGGKENIYVSPNLPPPVMKQLMQKKYGEQGDDAKLFNNVSYKTVWRTYKKYGVTPHIARGAYANNVVKQLIRDFKVFDGESGKAAVRRFNGLLESEISKRLNHTRSMTERSYLSETARQAVNDFRNALVQKNMYAQSTESVQENPPITKALGEACLWFDLGAGNTVI